MVVLLLGLSSLSPTSNVFAAATESESESESDADAANHTVKTDESNKYYKEYREELILDQQLKEAYESARKTLDTYNDVKSKLLLLSNDIISDHQNNLNNIPTRIKNLQGLKTEVATKTTRVDQRIREVNAMQIKDLKTKIEVLHQRELQRRSLVAQKEEFLKRRLDKALLKRKKKKERKKAAAAAAARRRKKQKLLKLKKKKQRQKEKEKLKKKKLKEKKKREKLRRLKQLRLQQQKKKKQLRIPESAIHKDQLQELVNIKALMEESDRKIEELFIEIVEQEVDTLQGELEETVIEATTALQDLEEAEKEKERQKMIDKDDTTGTSASAEDGSCSGATLTDAVQMVQQSLIKFSHDKVGMMDHLQKAHIVHHLTSPNFVPPSSQHHRSLDESWWFQYVPEDWEIGFDAILPDGWRKWNLAIPDYVYHTFGMYEQAATAPPEAILQSSLHPGSCWPMAGQSGQVTLRLPYPVKVRAVTMDHAPSLLFEDQTKRSSAPKKVRVFGFPPCWTKKETLIDSKKKNSDYLDDYRADSDDDDAEYYRGICDDGLDFDVSKPVVLHDFEYDLEGPTIQTFHIPLPDNDPDEGEENDGASCSQDTGTCGGGLDDFLFSAPDRSDTIREGMSAIRLEVTDNWGNKDYTCIYRFRIHGDAIDINDD